MSVRFRMLRRWKCQFKWIFWSPFHKCRWWKTISVWECIKITPKTDSIHIGAVVRVRT
uniref:Uncharacterized protein n=1 Tax=Lutzomyia longipalpis TaxID=7200 RepID=A0A1B0CGT6_LUTLO